METTTPPSSPRSGGVGGRSGSGRACSVRRAAPLVRLEALRRRRGSGTSTGILCLLLAWAEPGGAADTTETFDLGLGEFELYQSFDGLGRPLGEQTRTT